MRRRLISARARKYAITIGQTYFALSRTHLTQSGHPHLWQVGQRDARQVRPGDVREVGQVGERDVRPRDVHHEPDGHEPEQQRDDDLGHAAGGRDRGVAAGVQTDLVLVRRGDRPGCRDQVDPAHPRQGLRVLVVLEQSGAPRLAQGREPHDHAAALVGVEGELLVPRLLLGDQLVVDEPAHVVRRRPRRLHPVAPPVAGQVPDLLRAAHVPDATRRAAPRHRTQVATPPTLVARPSSHGHQRRHAERDADGVGAHRGDRAQAG